VHLNARQKWLALVIGYRARLVALALAVFSLVTALSFHRNFADQNQMIHFLKDVMLAGGLLQIVYFGAGPLSIDASRNQPRSRRNDDSAAPVSMT
jgi:putative oxidoreductase